MFEVGQQVVCIDDSPMGVPAHRLGDFPNCLCGLTKKQVYTIREIASSHYFTNGTTTVGIKLEEITRNYDTIEDGWFSSDRFRPVRKTDISIFTAMLTPTPVKENA